jgi:hypothetical protein
MIDDLQMEGTKEERRWRLIQRVIDVAEKFGWDNLGKMGADTEMLAVDLIEKAIKYNCPEDVRKANELAEMDGAYGGSYLTPILYFKYRSYLTDKAKANLLSDMKISMAPGNWLRVTKQGYGNVNIPQKGSQNNILGGEALGKVGMYGEAFSYGMKLLKDLCHIVNDCGMIPEYNSPCYIAVSLAPLATIANYAENKEAVLRAKLLQEIIFLDLCSRYHEPTNQIAGPYSREYLPNRIGGAGQSKYILYMLLPQGLFIGQEPHYQFFQEAGEGTTVLKYIGDPRSSTWAYCLDFQYHDFMNLLAIDKKYPYDIYMTTKNSGDKWDQDIDPGGRMDTSCYMTEEYNLASASREIMHGQSHGVVLFWRKKPKIQSMCDFKTMVWAYMSDDKKIGSFNKYAGIESLYWLLDEGRFRTVQNKNKLIALYQMKKIGTDHSSLKLNCYIPLYDELDELRIGDKKVESWPQYLNHQDIIFLKDAKTFVALRFLEASDLGREHEIVVSMLEEEPTHPKTLAIASYNYQGQMRNFKPEEYDQIRNGFVIEVADASSFDSFRAFRTHIQEAKVDEVVYSNGVWAVRYVSGKENLSITYHLTAHEIIERKINGKDVVVPMFSSPLVKEDRSGHIDIGRTTLDTAFGLPVWLVANEEQGIYMILNLNDVSTPVKLKTPDGALETNALPLGHIIYRPKAENTLEILSAEDLASISFSAYTEQPKVTFNNSLTLKVKTIRKDAMTWTYSR